MELLCKNLLEQGQLISARSREINLFVSYSTMQCGHGNISKIKVRARLGLKKLQKRKYKTMKKREKKYGSARNRTHDLLITSPLPYPLGYGDRIRNVVVLLDINLFHYMQYSCRLFSKPAHSVLSASLLLFYELEKKL